MACRSGRRKYGFRTGAHTSEAGFRLKFNLCPFRRAKAKHLNDKKARHIGGDWGGSPPNTPPQLSAGFEADLHSLIHEDQRELFK